MPVARFQGVPGIKIVAPSTPADAKALLKAAIRDDNPVLFFEHKRLYSMKGEVNGDVGEIGRAAVVREGDDVTLVSSMRLVHECLAAAEKLAGDGIHCEVIDARTLRPLDVPTVVRSVEKTTRLVVVEEGPRGGWAGELLAAVTEEALGDLDDAWRITTPDHPIPYSPPLEDAFMPDAESIARSIRER
jgi:pyruvate/2-oxoglutarate/acetoin dehydrogenase E1 component